MCDKTGTVDVGGRDPITPPSKDARASWRFREDAAKHVTVNSDPV